MVTPPDPITALGAAIHGLRVLNEALHGSAAEQARALVLQQLAFLVSASLDGAASDSIEPAAEAIELHLAFPSEVTPGSRTLAEALRGTWSDELAGLFEALEADKSVNVFSNLGLRTTLDELVEALLIQLPDTIGQYGLHIEPLHAVATEVRHNLQQESLTSLPDTPSGVIRRHGFGEQALQVVGFIQMVGVDEPTVLALNDSDAPITQVQAAWMLEAIDPARGRQPRRSSARTYRRCQSRRSLRDRDGRGPFRLPDGPTRPAFDRNFTSGSEMPPASAGCQLTMRSLPSTRVCWGLALAAPMKGIEIFVDKFEEVEFHVGLEQLAD